MSLAEGNGMDLWRLSALVRNNMRPALEQPVAVSTFGAIGVDPSLVAAVPFILFDGYDSRRARKCLHIALCEENHAGLNVSNVGRMNLPMVFGDYRAKRHVIVIPKFVQEQKTVTVLTTGGVMHIGMACDENNLPRAQAQAIFDRAIYLLKQH
jgi:hypothetical protein